MKQRASISILLLAVIAIIQILLIAIDNKLINIFKVESSTNLMENAETRMLDKLLNSFIDNPIPSHSDPRGLTYLDATEIIDSFSIKGNISISYQDLYSKTPSYPLIFPRLNLNLFRNSPQVCLKQTNIIEKPEPPVAFSSVSCAERSLLPQHDSEKVLVGGNLYCQESLILKNKVTALVRGLVDCKASIAIADNISLIALGDIFFKDISTNKPIKLKLISYTGSIKIDSISGPITLELLAKRKIQSPINYSFPEDWIATLHKSKKALALYFGQGAN